MTQDTGTGLARRILVELDTIRWLTEALIGDAVGGEDMAFLFPLTVLALLIGVALRRMA